jgi:hypothetical protein
MGLLRALGGHGRTAWSLVQASMRQRKEAQHLIRADLDFRITLEKAARKHDFLIPVVGEDFDGATMRNDAEWTAGSTKVCLPKPPTWRPYSQHAEPSGFGINGPSGRDAVVREKVLD